MFLMDNFFFLAYAESIDLSIYISVWACRRAITNQTIFPFHFVCFLFYFYFSTGQNGYRMLNPNKHYDQIPDARILWIYYFIKFRIDSWPIPIIRFYFVCLDCIMHKTRLILCLSFCEGAKAPKCKQIKH